MDVGQLIVFAHGGVGNLPDMDDMMFLLPVLPMLLIGTIVLASTLRKRGLLGAEGQTVSSSATGAAVAATLSTGAAAIHFTVVPEHTAEFAPFGLAFLAVGFFQVIWAQLYLLRPARLLAATGVVVNGAIVAVWLLSRTVGLPLGPTPWMSEPIGTLDTFASAFEFVLIAVVIPMVLPSRWPSFANQRMAYERAFVLAAFCLLTVTLLITFAVAGAPAEAGIEP